MPGKITIFGRGLDMAEAKAAILRAIASHEISVIEFEVLAEPEPRSQSWSVRYGSPVQHRVVGKRIVLMLDDPINPVPETAVADAPEDDSFAAGGWKDR